MTPARSSAELGLAEFRHTARAWLGDHAEPRTGTNDWSAPNSLHDPVVLAAYFARCREWQATLAAGGWAGLSWPTSVGGADLTSDHETAFAEELASFDATNGFLSATIAMLGSALLVHGTADQQRALIPRLLRGEDAWCQLFSEPEAGSDLASLRTRAERDGDHFVINGQKVWSSMAHLSTHGFILVRTDVAAPKHHGISFLLVDMASPGIEVRPLVQANGEAHFNEVFLTDVRVPVEALVGELNEGWPIARTVLAAESRFIGGTTREDVASRLIGVAQRTGRTNDPRVRQQLANLHARQKISAWMGETMAAHAHRGSPPPFSGAILKLMSVNNRVLAGALASSILGPALAAEGDPDTAWAQQQVINRFAISIGGGTDEVQRNNIAERELGLPRDAKPSNAAHQQPQPKQSAR